MAPDGPPRSRIALILLAIFTLGAGGSVLAALLLQALAGVE
jgi:hypothetical protein